MTDREKMVEVMAVALKAHFGSPHFDDAAEAALTALEEEGWAVVPVEPTKEMVEAGDEAMDWDSSDTNGRWYVHYSDGDAAKSWAAMLAAAPKP